MMRDESMVIYVNVPVPQEMVPEVMKLVSDRLASIATESAGLSVGLLTVSPRDQNPNRIWIRDQFELVFDSRAPSVKLFGDVLRVLAENSPSPMRHDEVAKEVGVVDGLTLQKTFGAVTRWMRKRWGGDPRWPIVQGDGTWAMNEQNAALCEEVARPARKGVEV